MNLVTLENVSKQYSERLLLDRVSLQINIGDRIGLIGVNGSGKSTLLRVIAGIEPPDAGRLTIPGGVTIQFLSQVPILDPRLSILEQLFELDTPQTRLVRTYEQTVQRLQAHPTDSETQQELARLTDEMGQLDGWAIEAKLKAILTRLGLTDFNLQIGTLSGGQQKRVALARALLNPADLLILDEPTNHIDADSIAWLEEYLAHEPQALLLVTHDRYFLERAVNRIVELDRRALVSYPGTYQRYLELRAERHERLSKQEDDTRRLLRRELEWLRRGAQARSTKQKARKQRIESLQQITHDQGQQVSLALASRRLGKQVLQVEGLSKQFDDHVLFRNVDFVLEPGDRIGIVGPNGTGKSTFLNILAGRLPADTGQVTWGDTVHLGYYDQQSSHLIADMRVIDFIEQEAPLIQTRDGARLSAFQMLEWFLFPRPQQYAQIGTLSGGERRRLYLLYVLMHQPNVLFLDEPTNDLDIQTLTVLEEFLDHFQGSLMVVSHDRYFLDRTVDFFVTFEGGKPGPRYPAPYSTYQMLRDSANGDELAPPKASPMPAPSRSQNRLRKLTWKEQRELEHLETEIARLESEQTELQTAINASGSDYLKLQQLSEQLQTVETTLEASMDRWLELSEIAEQRG